MAFSMRPLTLESALEDGLVPHVSARGDQFVQLYQRIPLGKYVYSPFEINYDTSAGVDFARNVWILPIVIVIVYLTCVYKGVWHMATRERIDLRYKMAGWNAFLCLFSFMGALRTVPDLLYRFGSEPITSTICTSPSISWGVGATGLWVQLFIFSKIPELIDTYFIVACQHPLICLHYYHHVTVLMYCWHSYATEASQALYFVAMNYSVHSITYGYYCLRALKMKPAWLPPVVITVVQIGQMFVGIAVQLAASYKYFTDSSCSVNGANIFWGGLMYSSYFVLFTKFAVERYMTKPAKKVV